jgi:hypothetical protein
MGRPRTLRSVEWRSAEGERLTDKPPFLLAPALSPQWEPLSVYEARQTAFFERRENIFAHITDAKRKREMRINRSPEQIDIERLRKQTPERLDRERLRKKDARAKAAREQIARPPKRFIGIDGEGGGNDSIGRQHYLMLAAAEACPGEGRDRYERVCHLKGAPLRTKDCLEFILSLPADAILVGFGTGYDVTQILRGINRADTIRRIINPPKGQGRGAGYTWWGEYGIIYHQGKKFQLCRIDRSSGKPRPVKGSCRTVFETLGFFKRNSQTLSIPGKLETRKAVCE